MARRYAIEAPIAEGGMGLVVSAWDKWLERPVVLKTVRVADHKSRARFDREVKVTARLQHPSIVPVYDAGTLEDGTPFYTMRRIEGDELETRIVRAPDAEVRLELVRPFIGLAEAIAYAHAEGFVHRDLKPQNVIVGKFGETVVLDWGIASSVHEAQGESATMVESPSSPKLTHTGSVMGTLGYIAPELKRGGPASKRSDVFSLGIIARRIVTAESVQRLKDPVRDALLEARAPVDLAAIIARATAVNPAQRYPDAGALAEDLRRFAAGRLVEARAYKLRDRVLRFARQHAAAVTVASVAVILLAALGSWTAVNLTAAKQRAEAARVVAEQARDSAESERESAERLIDLTLEDLAAELRLDGRLDALGRAIDEVSSYYAERTRPLAPPTALRTARVAFLVATLAEEEGNLERSLQTWHRALELSAEASADPNLVEEADKLSARVLDQLALNHEKRGDAKGAIRTAEQALASAQKHLEREDSAVWQIRASYAESTLMSIHERRGDHARSAAFAQRVLDRLDARTWPADQLAATRDLASSACSTLGGAHLASRRLQAALPHLERAVREIEEVRRDRPGAVTIDLVATRRFELAQALAQALALMGRPRQAADELAEVLAVQGLLSEFNPNSRNNILRRSNARTTYAELHPEPQQFQEFLGFSEALLGHALEVAGEIDPARGELERGITRLRDAAEGPSAIGAKSRLAYALLLMGALELADGSYERALESLTAAREVREALGGPSPSMTQRVEIAEVTAKIAVVRWKDGDRERAAQRLTDVAQTLSEALEKGVDPGVLQSSFADAAKGATALGVAFPELG